MNWIELSTMESQLFTEFFSPNPLALSHLNDLLNGFCTMLYTTLRPIIIHHADMDALAEVITIMKFEIIEEQMKMKSNKGNVGATITGMSSSASSSASASGSSSSSSSSFASDLFHPSSPLYAFSKSIQRLIADVQERLIYRAQLHIRESVQNYKHSEEDLDYPNKLMPHDSTLTSTSQSASTSTSLSPSIDSTSISLNSSPPTASVNASRSSREQLFASWHPALERTLMCLSKLYRCVEPSVFKYLAQESVSVCIQVLVDASKRITVAHAATDPSQCDGLLFLIKHLLILRDQLAPFAEIDWSIVQTDLDFSHMRDVLPNIFSSVGKWSSFIEIVQSSAPRLRESKMDAKKVSPTYERCV